jgi:CheY-like chemotaxis protein
MPSRPASLASMRPLFLVIDDNADSADSLTMLLQSWGTNAVAAYNGARGVEVADRLRPEVVLLDLSMPVMSGFETCRAIRRLPWGPKTTIVAVTGSAKDLEVALADAGFDGVFPKPVEIGSLQSLLAWMQRRGSEAPGQTPTTQQLPRFVSSA